MTSAPLNTQSAHECCCAALNETFAQSPPSWVVIRAIRQRCGGKRPSWTGELLSARMIAVLVLPVATRLALATAGTTKPTASARMMTRRLIADASRVGGLRAGVTGRDEHAR